MAPPLVNRKLIPLAQSIELPPPMATRKSTRCVCAQASPLSTCRVVGFSSTPSKTKTSRSALRRQAKARWGWPAASRPGSVTKRTRVPHSSPTSSPSLDRQPGPNTTRVRGGKSNHGSDHLKPPYPALPHEPLQHLHATHH